MVLLRSEDVIQSDLFRRGRTTEFESYKTTVLHVESALGQLRSQIHVHRRPLFDISLAEGMSRAQHDAIVGEQIVAGGLVPSRDVSVLEEGRARIAGGGDVSYVDSRIRMGEVIFYQRRRGQGREGYVAPGCGGMEEGEGGDAVG